MNLHVDNNNAPSNGRSDQESEMPLQNNMLMAFSLPGGEASMRSRARPVDLLHLARQTMGDRALETEILLMFSRQVAALTEKLIASRPADRVILAHTLKGSARSVGAVDVARLADVIENDPQDKAAVRQLEEAVREVQEFIAAISR